MSRRRKSSPSSVAAESLESRQLLCNAIAVNFQLAELEKHDALEWPTDGDAASYEVWLNDATSNQLSYRQDGLAHAHLALDSIEDGDYFAWIQNEDENGVGPWSDRQRIKIRDGQLVGSAGTLTWPEMSSAETYEVWISRDGRKVAGADGLRTNSFALPALDDGEYDYWIRRFDSAGRGIWNSRMTFSIDSNALLMPTGQGTLTWDADDRASGYEAWISSIANGGRVAGARALASNRFEVPTLDDGEYELWVRDEDSTGGGAWRERKPFIVECGRLKAPPTAGTLTWNSDADAVSYSVWVSKWGASERVAGASSLTNSNFRLPELDDAVYDYWIRTDKLGGSSEWGERRTFQVVDGELAEVESAGELTWQQSANALNYDVWISDASGNHVVSQYDVSGESTELPYLPVGLYSFWIRSNTAGSSAWSHRQYMRVFPAGLSTTSGYLYWGENTRAASYEIQVVPTDDEDNVVFQASGLTDTRIDIPMLPDGYYLFRIQHENSRGNGSWGDFVGFEIENGYVQTFQSGLSGSVITSAPSSVPTFIVENISSEPVILHL